MVSIDFYHPAYVGDNKKCYTGTEEWWRFDGTKTKILREIIGLTE